MDQELLVDELVQAPDLRIRLFDMDDGHFFRFVKAADGKGLQLAVDINAAHMHIERAAVSQYLMDPLYLIIQVAFHLLALLGSPFVQKPPHIQAVGAAQGPVLIPACIFPLQVIDMIFLLPQLFPG